MGTRQVVPADKAEKAYFWPTPWRYTVVAGTTVKADCGPFETLTDACTHLRENHPEAWAMNGPDCQPEEVPEPCPTTEPF